MENLVNIPFSQGKNILVDKFKYENNDKDIFEFLDDKDKISIIFEQIIWKVYMVLWWDGTILNTVNETWRENIHYLPINFWTKWFLLNSKESVWNTNWFTVKNFPLLDIIIKRDGQKILRNKAFNEVQIKAWWWKMIETNVIIWEHSSINLKWDWLLIVTPAWSTWYNLSANWPVLPHDSNSFIMTPLLTFEPKWARPVVFPNSKKVIVKKINNRKPEVSVFADSTNIIKDYKWDVDIEVKKSTQKVKLLIANSYLKEFDNKIYAEQWFSIS